RPVQGTGCIHVVFFFSSRRRHTRSKRDWSSDVCSSDLITLRSTKIRTLDGALTIVPNSKLTSTPITNWTRMNMRLCQFKLGLLRSEERRVGKEWESRCKP